MNVILRLRNLHIQCMCATAFLAASGCNESAQDRPDLVPVTGTVMYAGKPLSGATVSFWAEKAPRASVGVTTADGKFSLSMFDANDGAIPGDNVITVSKFTATAAPSAADKTAMMNDPTKLSSSFQKVQDGKTEAPKDEIPTRYAEQTTTPLKENVKAAGGNDFILQLAD